ncbi:MAG: fimbrial protein [Francisellaceae bacterium]|nr:fimbrial protein [Francisellaceae bacterium]
MIVIAIIGILAAIAIPNYQNYIKRSKLAEVINILESIKPQLLENYNANVSCPASLTFGNTSLAVNTYANTSISANIQGIYYGSCKTGNYQCTGVNCNCVVQALLTSNLGGGLLTLVMVPPSVSGNAMQFTCGFWPVQQTGQIGPSIQYAPSSCTATNLTTL